MALSPDDRTLLLAGTDGDLEFVDLASGAVQRVSPAGGDRGGRVQPRRAHCGDRGGGQPRPAVGRRAAGRARDVQRPLRARDRAGVRSRRPHTPQHRPRRQDHAAGTSAASRRLGRTFAFGDGARPRPRSARTAGRSRSPHADGTVTLVDPATLRTRTLRVGDGRLGGVAFTDDGQLLATVPRAARLRRRDRRRRAGGSGRATPRLGSPSTPSVDAGGRRMALVSHGAAMVQPLVAGRAAGRRALLPAIRRRAERGAEPRRPDPRRADRAGASRSSTSRACASAASCSTARRP